MAEKVMVTWEMDAKQALKVAKAMRGELGEKIPKSAQKTNKALKGVASSLASLFSVALIARGARDILRTFANYQTAAVNVQNITGLAAHEMELLGRQVRLLPPALGTATELMQGLYQAISAGVPHDNAVAFLAENAKAAKGNLAALTTTVDASTSVLAAYGLQTSETTAVLDAMTKTVDLGKLTFEELASNIGKGIGIAASAGVTYQELMATMAALTLSGLSVEEAMTGIRNILSTTLKMKPGEGMRKFGVEMSAAAIRAQGFAGYMGVVAEAVEGNDEAIVAMFGNLRAMNAAMSLVSETGGERLNYILGEIEGSAGKVESNFEQMSNTLNAKMAELGAVFERGKIEIGEAFASIFTEATGTIDIATAALTKFSVGLVGIRRFAAQVNLQITTDAVEKLKNEFDHYLELVRKGGPLQEHWRKKLRETGAELVMVQEAQSKANKAWDQTDDVLQAMLDQITGVTDGTGELVKTTKEVPTVVNEVTAAFKDWFEILDDLTDYAIDARSEWLEFWGTYQTGVQESTYALWGWENTVMDVTGSTVDAFYAVSDGVEESANLMQSTFSDLLGRGFIGELETFADLWDAIWQDLAKSMMGILGDAFEEVFSGDKGIGQGFSDWFAEMKKPGNALGGAIGGAGMMYSGYQQGGMGGAIQGMFGGAMAGAFLGPIAAAVGAAVGGIMSLFGGEDQPRVYGSLGLGGHQVTQSDTDLSIGARAVWAQQRIEEYRGSIMAMNDVLRLFGEGDLFDLIGDAPEFAFDEAGLAEISTIFSERWLPQAMREMFRSAINRGLGRLDVDADTRRQLWSELNQLTGANQIAGLETFISSLVNVSRLYDDMDWNAIMDESRQDSLTAFLGGMGDILDAVQTQMLGLDSMTLLERAGQAQTIEQLITQARTAEIQMLRQIDQLQESINRSISAQIEGLRTGGMSDPQLQTYYSDMIAGLMAQLRGGLESPEAIQQIMADLQRYVGLYSGSLGDSLYAQPGWGSGTAADDLIAILEEARGLSTDALEAMRDQIRETNDALILELQRLIDALTHYGDTIATADAAPKVFSGNLDLNLTVDMTPSEYFDAHIDARIERWEWQRNAEDGPN